MCIMSIMCIKAHVYHESNFCHPDEAVSRHSTRVSEQKCYHTHEKASRRISRVSGLEYYHPEEAVLNPSSPESYTECCRPKFAVSYRRSRVSEIEYIHPLDAVLFLAGSFGHTRP